MLKNVTIVTAISDNQCKVVFTCQASLSARYLLDMSCLLLLDILVATSCLSEHVRTCTYVGSARYSRIQDSHVMAPTSKPQYGAYEIANLAIASLTDIASAMAVPAGTNPPAREQTGACQTKIPQSNRERLHV